MAARGDAPCCGDGGAFAALAAIGPADQPTMELGLTVVASFLVGRSAAVLLRSRQEPQSDLHDSPSPPAEG